MRPALTIHRGSRLTVRRQIELEIECRILSGALPGGARLPSIRWLSAALDLHRNTVAAAYRSLGRDGLVTARPGSGVFVRRGPEGWPVAPSPPPARPVVLSRELELSRIIAAEYQVLTGREADPVSTDPQSLSLLRRRHVLATPPCLPLFRRLQPADRPARLGEVHLDPIRHLDLLVRRLPTPATVAVLTASDRAGEIVTAGIFRLRGPKVAVRVLRSPGAREARRLLPIANLAVVDPRWMDTVSEARRLERRPTAPLLLMSFSDAGFRRIRNLLAPVR